MIFRQSSSEDSASVPHRKSPTLFTTISIRPNRSTTVRNKSSERAASLISVSTATQSAPFSCNNRKVCCAATLFERYAIAIRAPSCASFTAIPRPIPRLPPVTSATRFCSPILVPHRSAPFSALLCVPCASALDFLFFGPHTRDRLPQLNTTTSPTITKKHQYSLAQSP